MGNMSYCMFKYTSMDLQDCLEAIENNELDNLVDYEYEGIQDILDTSAGETGRDTRGPDGFGNNPVDWIIDRISDTNMYKTHII